MEINIRGQMKNYNTDNKILRDAIDMDSWNHSWHLGGHSKAENPTRHPERVLSIIDEKIRRREEQIKKLRRARKIAEMYKNKQNEI